jgi:hypothetical protein
MSKIVRRLAAVAAIVVVLGVPGFAFAAVPVEQDRGDSPAAVGGVGQVLWDFWSWLGSVVGRDGSEGGSGGGAAGPPPSPPQSNAGEENPPTGGGGGDSGGGMDPVG